MTCPRLCRRFTGKINARLYTGDALAFLDGLRAGTADLILLDPPFNLGKKYGPRANDRMLEGDYEEWMVRLLNAAVRVLAEGGSLYLYHLPAWAIVFGAHLKGHLRFQHWIAVSMKNGFVRGRRLYPAHYGLLFFTKGNPTILNRPKLAVEYCQCGRTRKSYGGYLSIVQKKGLNLSDFWDDVSPVRHRRLKRRTANELPRTVTDRIVAISGGAGKTYIDPFAGAGSGILAAARAGMRIQACDIVRANVAAQITALEALLNDPGEM